MVILVHTAKNTEDGETLLKKGAYKMIGLFASLKYIISYDNNERHKLFGEMDFSGKRSIWETDFGELAFEETTF